MLKSVALLAALLIVFAPACGKEKTSESKKDDGAGEAGTKPSNNGDKPKADDSDKKVDDSKVGSGLKAPAKLTKGKFSKSDVPSDLKVEGKITGGLRFEDGNGDNWLIFSKKKGKKKGDAQSEYLYAQHYAMGAGGAKELRIVRDKVEDCEFDLTSDVSPSDYKFLMIENGDKYIIRGSMKLYFPKAAGEDPIGGERKIDKTFKDGPAEFLAHAKKRWAKLTVRRM